MRRPASSQLHILLMGRPSQDMALIVRLLYHLGFTMTYPVGSICAWGITAALNIGES